MPFARCVDVTHILGEISETCHVVGKGRVVERERERGREEERERVKGMDRRETDAA